MSQGTHSRTINGVKVIWKVEDLWQLAKDLPTEDRDPKTVIDLDRDGWFKGQAPTARLVLDHDGSIMDGAHRVCRAILENRKTVKVVRFNRTPPPSNVVL